jgi:hypothetical protein
MGIEIRWCLRDLLEMEGLLGDKGTYAEGEIAERGSNGFGRPESNF